jgi:hypothetical protein
MFHLLTALISALAHPVAFAAGLALGYLAPGSVGQAIAWIKSKV